MTARIFPIEHRTVSRVAGPLIIAEGAVGVGFDEVVEVMAPDGEIRHGRVLEIGGDRIVVQVLEGTRGLDTEQTAVRTYGRMARIGVGTELVGRILDGSGHAIDGGPEPATTEQRDVNGAPLNPVARANPSDFIETGISAIDGLASLVRGQKLPIFSGFGLPAAELAARITEQARVPGAEDDGFTVVLAALGMTRQEAGFFRTRLTETCAIERTVLLLNQADDPTIERLLTPRVALTVAEHLAFERGRHVLVILTDVTNYCEALREIGAAREEIPGRRGYPGYMYTDLASLFERAGRIHGRRGSLTQLMVVSMPDDDITHPIPDLTGYITEGQIVLARDLHRRGIDPPVDVLPSLSRLMNSGVGDGRTRDDHRPVADQLFALVARGREVRQLSAIVGDAGLTDEDRRVLDFASAFERRFVDQGACRRTIKETLDLAWELMRDFPPDALRRLDADLIARRKPDARTAGDTADDDR
jgi:V/A-type H+/Na+-transporting ATPase subunit B